MQVIGILMIVIGILVAIYNINYILKFRKIKKEINKSGEGYPAFDAFSEHYMSMLAMSVVILLTGVYLVS